VAFFQIFYLLTCRTLTAPIRSIGWTSNPYVFLGIGGLVLLQAGFAHLPVMQAVFRTADLTVTQWAVAAAAGALVVPIVGVEKWWRHRALRSVRIRREG
jgi:magnesium-transporting ATPase (P-type)